MDNTNVSNTPAAGSREALYSSLGAFQALALSGASGSPLVSAFADFFVQYVAYFRYEVDNALDVSLVSCRAMWFAVDSYALFLDVGNVGSAFSVVPSMHMVLLAFERVYVSIVVDRHE